MRDITFKVNKKEGKIPMYNPKEFEEAAPAKRETTEIIEIKEGTQGEFRSDAYWTKVAEGNPGVPVETQKQTPCIEIETGNKAKMVINLPKDSKAVHSKSSMARFNRTYGTYPVKGMKVDTKPDTNGFNRIVLEV